MLASTHHLNRILLHDLCYWSLLLPNDFDKRAIATAIRAYLFTSASERVVARLRKDLFEHLINQVFYSHCSYPALVLGYEIYIIPCMINQEIAFFDVTRTGELLSRLSEDTQIIKNAATVKLSDAMQSIGTALLGIGFMFHTSWHLTCGC